MQSPREALATGVGPGGNGVVAWCQDRPPHKAGRVGITLLQDKCQIPGVNLFLDRPFFLSFSVIVLGCQCLSPFCLLFTFVSILRGVDALASGWLLYFNSPVSPCKIGRWQAEKALRRLRPVSCYPHTYLNSLPACKLLPLVSGN